MRRLGLLLFVLTFALTGCSAISVIFGARPKVNISGHWSGRWLGHGINAIPREQNAFGEFDQRGAAGRGRLTLEGTAAAESVPLAIRSAGAAGSRVVFEVSGSEITMKHELGSTHLLADFKVVGDRLVGTVRDADPPVRIILARERPRPPQGPQTPTQRPSATTPAPQATATPPPSTTEPASLTPTPEPAPAKPEPGTTTAGVVPETESESEGRLALQEFTAISELKAVHFEFDKADVSPGQAAVLDQNVRWLKTNDLLVLIEGHADERGTNEYNLVLGERRAQAVRDYLVSRGVQADRVNSVSYGEERPLCTDQTEDCWRQNRRADLLVRTK